MVYDLYSRTNQQILEGAIVGFSFYLAFLIRYEGVIPPDLQYQFWALLLPIIAGRLLTNFIFGLHRIQWRYVGFRDALYLSRSYLVFSLVLLLARFGLPPQAGVMRIPASVITIEFLLSLLGTMGIRIVRRLVYERRSRGANPLKVEAPRRLLLIGAGTIGANAAKEMASDSSFEIVGFLDDDPRKFGRVIAGAEVLGTTSELTEIVPARKVDAVLVCIPATARGSLSRLVGLLNTLPVTSKFVPTITEILDAKDGLHLGIKTKNVLVIGGAGYIGSALSRQLLEAGYRVRVLDSLLFGDSSISDIATHPNFQLLRADFRNVESLVKAMEGIDAVVHLAAIVGDPACTIKSDLTTEINYAATRMLIEVCKGAGVSRLLFASTCSVYGASDFLMDERSAPNPISLYAQTKLDSERVILESKSPTLHPTCLRLATVFGFSARPRFDLVVNLLVARAIQDKKILIFNHEQWRPFIHVTDVAQAFVRALEAPVTVVSGEVFNVGSYELNYSLGDVAEKIRERIPQVEIEYKENPDKRNYRVSFDKIHSCLGFVCKTRLEDGIEEIKRAIETSQIGDYRDKVFSNYEYLLGARDELLRSEPSVQLFTVLEPDDVAAPTLEPKAYTCGASS